MNALEYTPKRLFTVDEANAALPLVRAIVEDIVQLANDLLERRDRYEHLTRGREIAVGDPYDDELTQVREELEKDTERLREFAHELDEIGVELKDAPQGLIDFPCRMDGRIVYLCWRHGEPEVMHWHEINAGFSGRQPLLAGSVGVSPDSSFDADI